jgi:hypothetical protein
LLILAGQVVFADRPPDAVEGFERLAVGLDPPRLHAGAICSRFAWNVRHTSANRITPPLSRARLTPANLTRAIVIVMRLMVRIGLLGDYRRTFWRMAARAALRSHHSPR